ncbi:MAG: endonuclease III domain-containing protein [Candidatus Nezhaarchaeales archaeon]
MKLVRLLFKIDDPQDYNLDLTLKPSFVSSLYIEKGMYDWAKQAGLYAGMLSLKQRDCYVEAYVACNVDDRVNEVVLYESGLWDEKPSSRISRLSGSLREHVKALSELFPGVRLSIAPHDFNCIFIAVVLSKRARYEVFVRNWVKELWSKWHCDPTIIAELKPEDIKSIGTSYQLMDLIKTLKDYLRVNHKHGEVEEIRRALMSCWGVGPKVADATLLFTSRSPWIVPCDTHLQRVSRRLGWVDRNIRMPTKSLCLRYHCDECVDKYGPCLRKDIEKLFPGFGGWVQTLTYLFGNSICTSQMPKCSLCHPVLREYCKKGG